MSTDIYFFSGSGNSLYLAKELKRRLSDSSLIPVSGAIKHGKYESSADTVAFVFPLHALSLPIAMRVLLRRLKLKKGAYTFAVCGRGGTRCFAFDAINSFLGRRNKRLDASFIINMFNNDPKFEEYENPSPAEIENLKIDVQSKMDCIAAKVLSKETFHEEDNDYIDFPFNKFANFLLERLVLFGLRFSEFTKTNNYFYSNEDCIGCGICAQVCQSEKIVMQNSKPFWKNDKTCYMCYSCLNYCPQSSVQIKSKIYMKSYTQRHPRYIHPFADYKDISLQKGTSYPL